MKCSYPEIFISDNATVFSIEEFANYYCNKNGIGQRFIAPEHPTTNRLEERYVRIIKNKLKSQEAVKLSLQNKVQDIIF